MTAIIEIGAESTRGSSEAAMMRNNGAWLLVVVEACGAADDSVRALFHDLPDAAGIAWLVLGDAGASLLRRNGRLPGLPVRRVAIGEEIPADAISLLDDPHELVTVGGRWVRGSVTSARSDEIALPAIAEHGTKIVHVLLGATARLITTALGHHIRNAGGLCASEDGGVLSFIGDRLPQRMALSAFAPWLVGGHAATEAGSSSSSPHAKADRSWSFPQEEVPPTDSTLERLTRLQGTSACLIDPADRLERVFGDHVFLTSQPPNHPHMSALPPAMFTPVAEVLQAARVSGAVERLLHLPFDDKDTHVRFVDMVFVPLETPEIGRPNVLVVASPARPVPNGYGWSPQHRPADASHNDILATQLSASRLHLKAAVEHLELGNERLQTAFDDLKEAHAELEAYAADLRALTDKLVRIDGAHRQKIAELEQLTADIESLLGSIDVGVVFVDLDLTVRRCAPIAARMLHLERPAEGRQLQEIFGGLGSTDLVPLISRTLENGRPTEIEIATLDTCRYLVRILAHRNAQDETTGAVVTLIDVTAYREAEAGRAKSEERWRRLVDTAPDAIILHEAGKVALANRSALRMLAARSADDLIGRELMELISPEGWLSVERQLAKAAADGVVADPASTAILTLEGRRIEVEITTSALSDGAQQAFQTVLRDVTDRRRAEAEIKRLVHHDGLTGLPNRTLLLDRLETATARASRDSRHGALMLLDLDQFKDVNDTLGHPAGDRLLQIVAKRLRGALRSTDTLARLGGDEFAIVQTDLGSEASTAGAASLAQKVLDAIALPFTIDDHDLFITSSLGLTMFPVDGSTTDQLIKNADLALYRAKAEGGHRFQFFVEQMNAEVLQKKSLERQLRRAIERGELSLVFQPQFSIEGGRPIGAEALVRWNHPEQGMIPPKAFIPVAEATGLIRPLGRWVLEEACRAIRRSIDAGHEIGIGVNLSAAQLRHGDFVGLLQKLLSDTGIRAELLEIEITESLLFEPSNDAIAVMLRKIAKMGVRLAVDDFGTGYSSLAYLKRFPVDKIKIDQSFIRDIGRDTDDDMIVTAMVTLAHSLGKRVIAEGVETERQLQFLRQLGCDEVQGYVLARPMSESLLTELLAQG